MSQSILVQGEMSRFAKWCMAQNPCLNFGIIRVLYFLKVSNTGTGTDLCRKEGRLRPHTYFYRLSVKRFLCACHERRSHCLLSASTHSTVFHRFLEIFFQMGVNFLREMRIIGGGGIAYAYSV